MAKRTPRPYQAALIKEYFAALHAGYRAPVIVLPTGGGKTFIFTEIVEQMAAAGYICLICCHRGELIKQISMSLATQGIYHDFMCSDKTRTIVGNVHQQTFGRSYFQPGAGVIVASVQTIVSRTKVPMKDTMQKALLRKGTITRLKQVTFGVFDEAHHLLKDNTFGQALPLVHDQARFLLVTATPERTDGKGIGCEALGGMGIADIMIEGPQMRELMRMGNLCDYDIFEPPIEEVDMSKVRVSASGDYNLQDQSKVMNKARITGDIVNHYKELAMGKLTIVFCCDIEHARQVASAYNEAGIPADVLHGGDDEYHRYKTVTAFERRDILVLVTVDLVSEGFDLPAIECVQYLRRSLSLVWYIQSFGRGLRPSPTKDRLIVLDHVGNWRELGLPDRRRHWSLANRKGGRTTVDDDPDSIPLTTCRARVDKGGKGWTPEQMQAMSKMEMLEHNVRPCMTVYEITQPRCPACGQRQPLSPRGQPVVVDGKLVQVPQELLDRMRGESDISDQAVIWRDEVKGEMAKLDMPPERYVASMHLKGQLAAVTAANHREWRRVQSRVLRPLLDEWMKHHSDRGVRQEAAQTLFLKRFDVNVYRAKVLRPKEAKDLAERVAAHIEVLKSEGGSQNVA